MILDTSFLLDLIDAVDGAIDRAVSLERSAVPQRVPVQVIYELYVGVGYTELPEAETERLSSVLTGRPTVATSEAIAKRAGRMDGELRRSGHRLPMSDLIIGATGIVLDEPVLTGDREHFERMPGVVVAAY